MSPRPNMLRPVRGYWCSHFLKHWSSDWALVAVEVGLQFDAPEEWSHRSEPVEKGVTVSRVLSQ